MLLLWQIVKSSHLTSSFLQNRRMITLGQSLRATTPIASPCLVDLLTLLAVSSLRNDREHISLLTCKPRLASTYLKVSDPLPQVHSKSCIGPSNSYIHSLNIHNFSKSPQGVVCGPRHVVSLPSPKSCCSPPIAPFCSLLALEKLKENFLSEVRLESSLFKEKKQK